MKGGLFDYLNEEVQNQRCCKSQLNIRYCQDQEVGKKNNTFLIFKACFLQKIRNLE